ncbi:hypothetical protein [Fluviicola sp.]|uniref:hypothetical protein n=1 Tax=Fluviicola sp. TaxID=1917219 RepID=UPI0026383CB2|nr:hypothetical protein [Fluviicola sp.]
MATIRIKYVVYKTTSSGRRNHHSINNMPLISETNPGSYGTGDLYAVNVNEQLVYEGQIVSFAFASFKGTANGSLFYTSIAAFQDLEVGSDNIEGVVVYLPTGGDGGNGFIVDAFNVDICDFSNSDFVDVFTNGSPDADKKFTANEYGTIDTAPSAVDVSAFQNVDGVPYKEWQKIKNGSTVLNDRKQPIEQNETGVLFAFYHTPASGGGGPVKVDPNRYRAGWIYVSYGVKVGGGGFVIGPNGIPIPVDPWTRFWVRLFTRVAMIFRRSGNVPVSDIQSAGEQLKQKQVKGMK